MASKLDLKREQRSLYHPSAKEPSIVEVPQMQYLMLDGKGDPNGPTYQRAVETIYPIAYALKFLSKHELDLDYVVMPLEGLWWVDDLAQLSSDDRSNWRWTSMIRQPDHLRAEHVAAAKQTVQQKKPGLDVDGVRLGTLAEGIVVQIMHIGPYSEEWPTIERMHAFAEEEGFRLRDKHHEIYLSDPRRSAPERMKTVLRHPIEPVA